jgi:hypothetical protein
MAKTTARLAERVNGTARVVPLRPRLEAATRLVAAPTDCCVKCGSVFIVREPAFIHCRYCGNMARILTGSLLDQELFELRSGLRLAS